MAEVTNSGGQLSLTQGGWDRRSVEWQLQVETVGIEIDQVQRQILAAERRRDIALRELNTQQQQIEHAIEVQDFVRDKFTNGELYLYLQQETAALYRQMYDLALHAARRAQRAFNRERGHTARRFLPEPGWEARRHGREFGAAGAIIQPQAAWGPAVAWLRGGVGFDRGDAEGRGEAGDGLR